jgi:hypothetical protein
MKRKKKNEPVSLNDELPFDDMADESYNRELEELLKHTPKAAAAKRENEKK